MDNMGLLSVIFLEITITQQLRVGSSETMFHQTGASKDIKEEEVVTPLGDSTKNWQTFVESGSSYYNLMLRLK